MALKTNVPLRYRRAYIHRKPAPPDVISIMRKEITTMRYNLLKKQKRLADSDTYTDDKSLTKYLQGIKVRDLNTDAKVHKIWSRLRSLQESNFTSVSGLQRTDRLTRQTLKDAWGLTFKNNNELAKYGEFLNWVKENYGQSVYIASDAVGFYRERVDLSADELEESFEQWIEDNTSPV